MNTACAEIIESSLPGWTAQSWQWDSYPPFGALVTICEDDMIIFGLVYHIQTGSTNPLYTPVARKQTENELRRDQPHIFHFLQTTLHCLTLGYKYRDALMYQYAPRPPKIHAHVIPALKEDYSLFFSSEQYLHVLFNASPTIGNLDELLLALLKNRGNNHALSPEHITTFMKTFSLLTGNDYRRLKLFLQRAHPIILPHLTQPQGRPYV